MTRTKTLTDWQMLCLEDAVNTQIARHLIDTDSGAALLRLLREAKTITVTSTTVTRLPRTRSRAA